MSRGAARGDRSLEIGWEPAQWVGFDPQGPRFPSSSPFLEWPCETAEADLMVCGHTGLHWHRALPSGRHVVNVGAIGRPANDRRPVVRYAEITLGGAASVEFRLVDYDCEALAREMEGEQLPPEFVTTIRTGWWTTCLENLPAKERMGGQL